LSLLRDRTRSIGARPSRAAAIAWLLAGALVAAISPVSPVRLGEAQPVRAALSVRVTGDAADARPGDGVCATEAGLCTLRAAIQEANAVPGPDSIELPAGTFELAVPPVNENGIETGDLDITDALTIAGTGAAASVIDAGEPQPGSAPEVRGLDRLFEVHASAGEVELSGLTIATATRPSTAGPSSTPAPPVWWSATARLRAASPARAAAGSTTRARAACAWSTRG
jgi:CSLREA domain-containing protein